MCGIVGAYRADIDIESALERIESRGPDNRDVASHGVAEHGHVRLAIRDPDPRSNQPFEFEGGTLSFVGEIWNADELRDDLDVDWQTTGDTEVLAAALARYGVDKAVDKLDGMFTFAWSHDGEHVLVRDRFGVIPLYAKRKGERFVWSSERKALPDQDSMMAVKPGKIVDLKRGKIRTYYEPPMRRVVPDNPVEQTREQLRCAVHKRMVSDVPVCCLISGGLDSSLILRFAKEINPDIVAYTAVFDKGTSDHRAARYICDELGVELREVHVDLDESSFHRAMETIEIASKAQIEIAVMCIPLARRISEDGFRVCLSGESADELFGGYGNMSIQSSQTDSAGWRRIRRKAIGKMGRGNFVRINKSFMAESVEPRTPFVDQDLIESVLTMPRQICPPGKDLLKEAATGLLPDKIIHRSKETFQGGSGSKTRAADLISRPIVYYNNEVRKRYGRTEM